MVARVESKCGEKMKFWVIM